MSIKLAGEGDSRRENARRGAGGVVSAPGRGRDAGGKGAAEMESGLSKSLFDVESDHQVRRNRLPAGVRRYFCRRLLGFSGMVGVMAPRSTSRLTISCSWPDGLLRPSARASSVLPSGPATSAARTCDSTGDPTGDLTCDFTGDDETVSSGLCHCH